MGGDTFLGKLFGGPLGGVADLTNSASEGTAALMDKPAPPDEQKVDETQREELNRRGRASTVLSGYRGVEGPTNPGVRKTLLGG